MKIFDGRIRKKASLQLSINAIVVLILAITVLGLGLGFIKKTFSKATGQLGEVTEEIEKQMIDRLLESPKPVALSAVKAELDGGESKDMYLAIRNDLSSDVTWTICDNTGARGYIDCIPDYKEDTNPAPVDCTAFDSANAADHCSHLNVDDEGNNFNNIKVIAPDSLYVEKSGAEIVPVKVQVLPGAPSDTYTVPIYVIGTDLSGTTKQEIVRLQVVVE